MESEKATDKDKEKDRPEVDLDRVRKVYFIGIGGIGMSAIARFMKAAGKTVQGSDLKPSQVTRGLEALGIGINYLQAAENITDDIDLAVYTLSIPETNLELSAVRRRGIPAVTYSQSLGLVFNGKRGIAICGTHGKSTTSAMVGGVLEDGGIDPSVLVGSIVPRYGGNLRVGEGGHFVAEACEYGRNFMSLYPHIIILNNIELDHTDCYADIEEMKASFLAFLRHLPESGVLFCGDDKNVREVVEQLRAEQPTVRVFYFGKDETDDVYFKNYRIEDCQARFEVFHQKQSVGLFHLRIPGEFNARNSLAAIGLGFYLGVPLEKIRASLESFTGIWRRFEIKGKYRDALIVSDYAHHPTAVRLTIEAARQFYPGRRIVAVFQPHQHNRTRGLYTEFLESFDLADEVILSEIYDVAGREEAQDQSVSSRDLAEDIQKRDAALVGHVRYAPDLDATRKLLDDMIKPGDVVLVMGAGDIFEIADQLVHAS